MTKALAVAILTILTLTACVSGSEQVFKTKYTLTGAGRNVAASKSTKQAPSHPKVLRLAPIAVPAWLNTDSIYYRLDYRNNSQIAAYSQSSWVSPPAPMLTALIQRELATSSAWAAVIGSDDSATANYTLRVRLLDFQQDFGAPKQSHCLLTANATIIDNETQAIAGQRNFTYNPPAPSADAAGGVTCLSEASQSLAGALRRWLEHHTPAA